MNSSVIRVFVVVAPLIRLCSLAQTPSASTSVSQMQAGKVPSASSGFVLPQFQGCPYSAMRTTTLYQVLPDGATITQTRTDKEARDSLGRTMHEMELNRGKADGRPVISAVNVRDPVGHQMIDWSSQSTEATLFRSLEAPAHQGPAQYGCGTIKPPRPEFTSGNAAGTQIKTQGTQPDAKTAPASPPRPITRREQLPGKMIDGVYAEGVRTTTTMPIGSMGNDKPLVSVQETWTSPELDIVLERSSLDYRGTLSTQLVTEINRSEPDPAAFQPPPGYTLKERQPE